MTVAGIAIIGVVGVKSFQGCFPTITPDTWAYASIGQYLAEYSRGTGKAVSLIDQFAAYLSDTRFGTASLLGFLSVVLHTSSARALLPALLVILTNGLLGFYSLSRLFGASQIIAFASGIFFVLCGWTFDAICIGNLDNLLFLSLSAAFLARLLLIIRGCRGRQALTALAINCAAAFYSYPEGFVLTAAIIAPFVFEVGVNAWKVAPSLRRGLIVTLLAVLVFVAPYLPTWMAFLSHQISVENSQFRAGEGIFPGLLGPGFLPALFGLGDEFSLRPMGINSAILVAVAAILCVAGIISSTRFRIAKASAFSIVFGLAILQGGYLKYDYGLYKIIFLGCVIWLPAIFLGVQVISRTARHRHRLFASVVACVFLQLWFLFERFENRREIPYQEKREIRLYEQIQALDNIVGTQGVVLSCINDFEYEWGLFYARRLQTQLLEYKSYLKLFYERDFYGKRYLLPSLENNQVPVYILSDLPRPGTIWSNGIFWLSKLAPGVSIILVDSPNGLESVKGKNFLWIGNQPTKFFVFSDKERPLLLSAEATVMGPSISDSRSRRICVRSGNTVQELELADQFVVALQLRRGISEVEVWCKDRPEILKQPNGDTRILLFGLLNYQVEANCPGSSSDTKNFGYALRRGLSAFGQFTGNTPSLK
jgi:hypothetical protein